MSGETERAVSGWTVDTLHAHVQQQLDDIKSVIDLRFRQAAAAVNEQFGNASANVALALLAQEKAVTKAEIAADKRFESMNEFRGQLSDQASTLMPRIEAEARFTAITEKFDAEAQRSYQARSEIASRLDLSQGRTSGLDKGWGYLIGAIGAVGGLVALIVSLRP